MDLFAPVADQNDYGARFRKNVSSLTSVARAPPFDLYVTRRQGPAF